MKIRDALQVVSQALRSVPEDIRQTVLLAVWIANPENPVRFARAAGRRQRLKHLRDFQRQVQRDQLWQTLHSSAVQATQLNWTEAREHLGALRDEESHASLRVQRKVRT